jgi:hypothetical protein
MIPKNYKSISSSSTSSLTYASIYTKEESAYLTQGVSKTFPFGLSNKDLVEFSIYSTDGSLITSSYTTSKLKSEVYGDIVGNQNDYTSITRSYVDVSNNLVTYSYSEFNGNFAIVNSNYSGSVTQSVLINIQDNLRDLSVQEGNYQIGILPVRNLVGNPIEDSQKLVIGEISPTRQEISVIPYSTKNTDDAKEQNLNDEFELFSYSKIKPKLIIDELMPLLEKVTLYTIYFDVAKKNPDTDQSIKFYYSLKSDVDVVNFVTDLYYGVKRGSLRSNGQVSSRNVSGIYDQFRNFLFQNYETITTFQQVKDYYYSLFSYVLNRELNQITNTSPENYDSIVAFFRQIYYDSIFFQAIGLVEKNYSENFTGYLKNSMNFGKGRLLPILNTGVIPSNNPTVHDRLILKLKDLLPTDIQVGDTFWISNTSVSLPILQNTHFFSVQQVITIPVKGPNFNIKMENEGNSTIGHSLETIVGESGSLYDELYAKLRYKIEDKSPVNVDYRSFENFIKFSSAGERLDVYGYKKDRIEAIRLEIADLDAKLILAPTDEYYIKEKSDLDSEWNSLESSMDGYENFLYNNPNWYSEHIRIYSGVSSGSRFDRDNADSLQNNLPSTISENPDNGEYVHFVNLIGHYFDNLTLYITQFTEKNNSSNSEIEGISKDVVYNMLSSLGWEPEIGRENIPLILSSFSKDDFDVDSPLWDKVGTMSEDDRNKLIWKRILNNLPYILKSKGTESAINALISCYGIPRNLIQIKEYGGVEYTTELNQNSLFVIDETKYSPSFSGSGEYFDIPWTGSAQSLEFNFSFDTNQTNSEGQVFRLAVASSSWAVGIVREKGNDWGKAFFTIQDTDSNILTTTTARAPFFNGDVYSVVLRHAKVDGDFNLSPTASISVQDNYPQSYDLLIHRNEDSRTTFSVSSSIFLSGSYNTSFRRPTHLYFGNYQQNTSSLSIDPEAFFGTIDEIRVWETYLPTDRFNHHASFKGSYDSQNPLSMPNDQLVRLSFSTPINLHTSSVNLTIGNSAFRTMAPISASNFPFYGVQVLTSAECNTYSTVPAFPYQFKKFETRQTMNLPNFGSNKFRSNKVNYKEQILTSNLSPESRSTLKASEDSTVDTNKLGIFFSPTDQLNIEIIKFFGNFEFGDLIGNPADLYQKSYGRFEKFKEVFFNQGFGNIDYQGFMNLVRAYFDKSLFKYIKTLVPARAKLVDGLLVEPSILERPKIQLKPIFQETVKISEADLTFISQNLPSVVVPQLSQSLKQIIIGKSVYEDVEGSFYPDRLEPYGFSILGNNGVTYYKDDYWRVEVIPVEKTYTVRNKNRPTSSMSDSDAYLTERGEFSTVTKNYEQVNISRFPVVSSIPNLYVTYCNMNYIGTFSGSGFSLSSAGVYSGTISSDVTLSGTFVNDGVGIGMVSSSASTGNAGVRLGITATILSGSALNISLISVPNNYRVYLTSGTMTSTITSLDETKTIFDVLVGNASGLFFSNIRDSGYSYRYNLSAQNSPLGSYPLNGYYGTHYKYKKPFNDRNEVITLDKNNLRSGVFKKGLQTEKTTVQSGSGLFDNSPAVVITSIQ